MGKQERFCKVSDHPLCFTHKTTRGKNDTIEHNITCYKWIILKCFIGMIIWLACLLAWSVGNKIRSDNNGELLALIHKFIFHVALIGYLCSLRGNSFHLKILLKRHRIAWVQFPNWFIYRISKLFAKVRSCHQSLTSKH
jgi:hypothetical protein